MEFRFEYPSRNDGYIEWRGSRGLLEAGQETSKDTTTWIEKNAFHSN
jgi:hypothetical protein